MRVQELQIVLAAAEVGEMSLKIQHSQFPPVVIQLPSEQVALEDTAVHPTALMAVPHRLEPSITLPVVVVVDETE